MEDDGKGGRGRIITADVADSRSWTTPQDRVVDKQEHRAAGDDGLNSASTMRRSGSSTVLEASFPTLPSDDPHSSSSTSSSPQSCSFSSTTGFEASESAASSTNSDGEWHESSRLPTSFSTDTMRAALESAEPYPHKTTSLPVSPPHPSEVRTIHLHTASEPGLSPLDHHGSLYQLDAERTPVPDSNDQQSFAFSSTRPLSDSPTTLSAASNGSANPSALSAQLASHPIPTLDTDIPDISSARLSPSPSTFEASTNATSEGIAPRTSSLLGPAQLADRLERGGLLVVDVRSLSAFLGPERRLRGSINVNFPTLLIKRFRKGNSSSFNLSSFVTTEAGKQLLYASGDRQHPDIVVVDDRHETRDMHSLNPGSVLLSVLERRGDPGALFYLDRPLGEAVAVDARLRGWMVEGEMEDELRGMSATLSQDDDFDAQGGSYQRGLQPIDPNGSPNSHPRLSPHPRTPTYSDSVGSPSSDPSRSLGGTSRPRPPKLKRIDTSENLLGSRGSVSTGRTPSRSPAAPALRVDASGANNRTTTSGMSLQAVCHMQAKSPASTAIRFAEAELTLPPPSAYPSGHGSSNPSSPEDEPRTSVADVPPFIVSIIIPGFLYLGPEPTRTEDLDELQELGVKEVLNLALECEDKDGEVARRFELRKIGMRDFVEETGVQQAIEEACRILGDAQLQSKPVYCHCRAGKSRSVTIVLAYLVHRNHWPLTRAYAHVSERRKGISPNIGFVAELMTWEERERGRKSSGVFGTSNVGGIPISSPPLPPASAPAPSASQLPPLNSNSSYMSPPSMARSTSDQGQGAHVHQSSFIAPEPEGDVGTAIPRPPHVRKESQGGEREGREVRAADGTWMAASWEEHDELSNPQRRSSRAGPESFAPTRLGD